MLRVAKLLDGLAFHLRRRTRGESIFEKETLRKSFAEGWNRMTVKAVKEGPVLFGENYPEVRYEDLLERPAEEIGRLLRFLGVDDGEITVERCMEATSFERLEGQEEGRGSFILVSKKRHSRRLAGYLHRTGQGDLKRPPGIC